MGFRFRKSVTLFKGIRLNFGRRGVGISAGVPGFRVGVNSRGTYTSVGVPGTGVSWFSYLKRGDDATAGIGRGAGLILGGFSALILVGVLISALSTDDSKVSAEPQASLEELPAAVALPSQAQDTPSDAAISEPRQYKLAGKPVAPPARSGCFQLADETYLRSNPDGAISARLPSGTVVALVAEAPEWALVEYVDKRGYIASDDLERASEAVCVEYTYTQGFSPQAAGPMVKPDPAIDRGPDTVAFGKPVGYANGSFDGASGGGGSYGRNLPNLDMSRPVHVREYTRKDGTHVRAHTRSR